MFCSGEKPFVAGLKKLVTVERLSCPFHITTRPVGKSAIWTATTGVVSGGLHWPTWAGSADVVFATVTLTDVAWVRLPATSRATAESVCGPLPIVFVVQAML